jgi:hypothetical protein
MILTFFSRCINTGRVVNKFHGLMASPLAFAARPDTAMTEPVFQQAFETVRKSYSDEAWNGLTPRQITEAIYQEIRRIDADLATRDATYPAASSKETC